MRKERVFGHTFVRGLLIMVGSIGLALACAAFSDLYRPTPRVTSHGTLAAHASNPALMRSVEVVLARTAQNSAAGEAIIIDHAGTDVTAIPLVWIEAAKRELHIIYGHTSHGSQLTTGMAGLVDFANNGGLGLALPQDTFTYNSGGTAGALDLREPLTGDAGYYPQWVNSTRDYLGTPYPGTGRGSSHPETNVVVWSWCGQVSGYTAQQMLDNYLLPMAQLEADYPGIVFVYMTGHADGTGEEGNLHLRNQQIRDYCIANDKVLYDFYDIELYDPDENYYGDKAVTDECDYDSDGNGTRDRNWAVDWQGVHTEDTDWYSCYCAHSEALNCNQKAYAAWWLWARLAGWDGGGPVGPPSQKIASTETAVSGQTITYTISVQNVGAPLDATVTLTDTIPEGLIYVPGTLTSTAGTVSDGDVPLLHWTGVLSPTPAVTVTYATTVDVSESQVITNNAVVASPGYEPITLTAPITVEAPPQPDLTPSYKIASPSYGGVGDQIMYTVVVRSSTGPLSHTILLTDTIPPGLVYLPGTLSSTAGLVSEASAPTLYWSGVLSPSSLVTVTYGAAVSAAGPAFISNKAVVALPGSPIITRTASILANPYRQYLPVVLRNG